jgi:hypothetical protein
VGGPWQAQLPGGAVRRLGKAVQVDPINPKLKPPGTNCLKLKCDILLSTSAFKFNLRRYDSGGTGAVVLAAVSVWGAPTDRPKLIQRLQRYREDTLGKGAGAYARPLFGST